MFKTGNYLLSYYMDLFLLLYIFFKAFTFDLCVFVFGEIKNYLNINIVNYFS